MTTPVYPSHLLPCFLIEGHSYRQQNTIQKTQFQTGRTRRRRLFVSVPEALSVSTKMTDEQLETFEAWIHHKVKDVGWFEAPIHTARGYTNRTVTLENNDFSKDYQGSGLWKITLSLMTEKQNYLSETELDARL